MSDVVEIQGEDGKTWRAYRAEPNDLPRGAIIVVQEIFGLTAFIRDYCDQWAAAGYFVLAPALFDQHNRDPAQSYGLELAYDEAGIVTGRAIRQELGVDDALGMIAHTARAAADAGPISIVGFCWGGSLAFLAATRLRPEAAIGYYGGQIKELATETAHCPLMLHFGENDPLIPAQDVAIITANQPSAQTHLYPAGHGFACTHRRDFHATSAKLAWQRDLDFIAKNASTR